MQISISKTYSWQFMIFHSVEGSVIEEIKQLWMWWWCHSVHLLTKSCKRGSLLEQQMLIARLEVRRVTTFFSPINSCNRVVKPDCLTKTSCVVENSTNFGKEKTGNSPESKGKTFLQKIYELFFTSLRCKKD